MIEIRPRRLTRVSWAATALVLVAFGVLALLLPKGGQDVGVADQVSFFLFGVLLAAALVAFTRFRVRADVTGVWVRNVLGERYFPWGVVIAVDLAEGASWAQLELHDDETVALLALQSNDGDATIDSVLALRELMQTAHS
ncbi:MAG: PH domain-containing protein [Mycobacteriales bacterium]